MTKTQIWVAGFLVLFLILFGLQKLTQKDEAPMHPGMEMNAPPPAGEQNALSLINANGCTSCHGQDLKGSNLGPGLTGLKENWSSRESLINYLRNPNSFMDEDRFKDYKQRYNTIMPPFNNLDVKDLGKIADYLLTL